VPTRFASVPLRTFTSESRRRVAASVATIMSRMAGKLPPGVAFDPGAEHVVDRGTCCSLGGGQLQRHAQQHKQAQD